MTTSACVNWTAFGHMPEKGCVILLFIEETWNVGSVIKKMREEQGLTIAQLCSGLCSTVTMSRIENGERDMDIFLTTMIFGRLGYRPDKYELYGSAPELEQWNQRQNMKQMQRDGKYEQLAVAIQNYKEVWKKDIEENPFQKQFVLFIEGVIELQDNNPANCIGMLENAIRMTVPQWSFDKYIIGAMAEIELSIVDTLCDAYEMLVRDEDSYTIRWMILTYLEKHSARDVEMLQLYVSQICKLASLLLKRGNYRKSLELCETGLKAIGKQNRLYSWPELLYLKGQSKEMFLKVGQATEDEVIRIYQEAYFIYLLFENDDMAVKIASHLREAYQWECIV